MGDRAYQDTIGNANGGLDCETGPARSQRENLVKAVNDGKVKEDTVDDKVRRTFRVAEFTGRLDNLIEIQSRVTI